MPPVTQGMPVLLTAELPGAGMSLPEGEDVTAPTSLGQRQASSSGLGVSNVQGKCPLQNKP